MAYNNLGCTLPKGGVVRLANGKTMTPQELFLKVIELEPNHLHATLSLEDYFLQRVKFN